MRAYIYVYAFVYMYIFRKDTVILDRHTLALLKVCDNVFDELREMVRNVSMCGASHVVIVGIQGQAPIIETPGQIVNGLLLVLNHLPADTLRVRKETYPYHHSYIKIEVLWSSTLAARHTFVTISALIWSWRK